MKLVLRAFPLWLILGGLSCLLARAAHEEAFQSLASGALFVLPALAVWLTSRAVAALPERRSWRIGFWVVTVGGWAVLLTLTQGRAESRVDERPIILSGLVLAALAAIWPAIKARSFPSWRVLGEVAVALVIVALTCGTAVWIFDARTRSIVTRADARWTEIGMPMAEFEKTLTPDRENAGSEAVRQALREEVNSLFYKNGTRAAQREPALRPSPAAAQRIKDASKFLAEKLPPSDDVHLAPESIARFEPVGAALDADYRRILANAPATWASDPHDGFFISVPNFLGIRHFAQITAVDSLRRLSTGDEDGAARALGAGLRLRDGLRENPTLVSLMIAVAVDALLSSKQVRLPAAEDGLASLARDVPLLRTELLRRVQIEAWVQLRMARQARYDPNEAPVSDGMLPGWATRVVDGQWYLRQFAVSALNGAEHAAILKSPATLALPDMGASLHNAISDANPTIMEANVVRAIMRIHATLLLREQTELIRDARARLAAGRPVESRDSVVLPGVRWELTADAEKGTVATRLTGAPPWIVKNEVTNNDFWTLPIDGSEAWQFHLPARTAGQ